MNACDEYAVKALRYLDGDLRGKELEEFRSHVDSCANCQAHLEAEAALSDVLHGSRPLYTAPLSLRTRVSAAINQHAVPGTAADGLHASVFRGMRERLPVAARRFLSVRVLAPVTLAIALCLTLVPSVVHRVEAASYVEAALTTHRGYLNSSLPPGLRSSSPEQVSAWFEGKVPYRFRLPTAESAPEDRPAYRLTGASLVRYKGNPAALVTYETKNDKISLLVASSESAIVAGGEKVKFGRLTLHYRMESGFKVITWSNHRLSYALVSSVSGSARSSCMVCHQNMADRDSFWDRP